MSPLNELAEELHKTAVDYGWWPDEERGTYFPTKSMLIVTEVSEAVEAWRNGDIPAFYLSKDDPPKPEGHVVELIDVLIRTLDLLAHEREMTGIDIDEIMGLKMAYNTTRLHRHGGLKA